MLFEISVHPESLRLLVILATHVTPQLVDCSAFSLVTRLVLFVSLTLELELELLSLLLQK